MDDFFKKKRKKIFLDIEPIKIPDRFGFNFDLFRDQKPRKRKIR
jgi:hypothetical protein